MPHVLVLAGCGPGLEIGLGSGEHASPSVVVLAGAKPRNEMIVAAVDLLLRGAGISAAELGGVAVTRGPGSFTGLRVTLATAQALALACGVRGRGFSSLRVQAERAAVPSCLAVQPARRGTVYAQRYVRSSGRARAQGDIEVLDVSAVAGLGVPVVAPEGLSLPPEVPGATPHRTTVEALLALFYTGDPDEPNPLEPLYAEPPSAVPRRQPNPPWQPSPKAS